MMEFILPGIVILVIIGLVIWFVSLYNRFYALKNSYEATLGQIKVALKKRLDMIDQLLGAVKSYALLKRRHLSGLLQCGHQSDLLELVISQHLKQNHGRFWEDCLLLWKIIRI